MRFSSKHKLTKSHNKQKHTSNSEMKNKKRVRNDLHSLWKHTSEIQSMKQKMNMKGRLRRLKKKEEGKEEKKEGKEEGKEEGKKEEVKSVLKEGWLKIHAESLLDEETYPELLLAKTEFQRKEKKVKIEVDEENHLRLNTKNNDLHYFRLTKENLWYTETETDPVVLGSLSIKNLEAVEKGDSPECIRLSDKEEDMWILCQPPKAEKEDKKEEGKEDKKEEGGKEAEGGGEKEEIEEWECELLKLIGEECEEGGAAAPGGAAPGAVTIKREIIKQPLIIIPIPSLDCATDWGYSQNGADWQCKCNEGFQQSPVDLPPKVENFVSFLQVGAQFSFNEVKKEEINLVFHNNLLRIVPINDKVLLGTLEDTQGNLFNALEIQLHTPAEHKLNNKKYDLEVQIIYEAIAGDFKKKAVVSFLFLKKAGIANGFWDTVAVMDLPTGDHPHPAPSLIKQDFHIYQMLFETLDKAKEHQHLPFDYFQYEGSLTSPSCEEYTTWYIVDTPFFINGVVLEFMHDSTFDVDHCSPHTYLPTFFTGTNRLIQDLHGRTVYHYSNKEYCGPTFNSVLLQQGDDSSDGHYEKVEKTQTKYYFVKGQEPSGMPGALVVSGEEEEDIKKQHQG